MSMDGLLARLTKGQMRDALSVLLEMPDPACRWTLESIAIASPAHAAEARALKRADNNYSVKLESDSE